ncbi:MAG: threonine--tRNA ligase [Elusimicrobiota bacterium]
MSTQIENKEEYLYKLRHSAAHVLAEAVKDLFPETKLTIGPPTEDGFYYDFDSPHRFTIDDLAVIENKMNENLKTVHPFEGSEISRADAIKYFEQKSEKFKVEIINDLPPETKITLHKHGKFTDLCKGNHLDSTADIKYFKLLKVAGAYWRGDEKREQLQRVYGTIWTSKEELDSYLTQLEEAKKRDHRELGPKLGLFTIEHDEVGSGLVLWLPKGALIRHFIEDYLKKLHLENGYQFAISPHVGLSKLWETSGHLDFYKENMFPEMKLENQSFYCKPMTCPFHISIYKTTLHSYRELPIRMYEHGTVYRFERSGVLHGTLRVRGFTQDDTHIFCRQDQLEDEIKNVMLLAKKILSDFGFFDYEIKLSTRPKEFVGDPARWELAEKVLADALHNAGFKYEVDPGQGAFYGPKIDLKIKDSIGRRWQCSTVQVDFNLPDRFKATYRNDEGKDTPVFMVHRAILGSIERFFGILVEHFSGAFPPWLAPVQAVVLPISDKQIPYAEKIVKELKESGFRAELRAENEKVGAKIRTATLEKIPYMLVVGAKEEAVGSVSVRSRTGKDHGVLSLAQFISQLQAEIVEKKQVS